MSDDEDRRRDKFRGERSSRENSPRRSRSPKRERSPRASDRFTEPRRERSRSPTHIIKRARMDPDNPNGRPQPFVHFARGPNQQAQFMPQQLIGGMPTMPMMPFASTQAQAPAQHAIDPLSPLSFRNWVISQDDSINEDNAVARYADYKATFLKRQLADFFDEHKNQEWFREKYHPTKAEAHQAAVREASLRRLSVYNTFADAGKFDLVALTAENIRQVHQLMEVINDAVDNDGTDEPQEKHAFDIALEEQLAARKQHEVPSSDDDADYSNASSDTEGEADDRDGGRRRKRRHASRHASKKESVDNGSLPLNAHEYSRTRQQSTLFLHFIPHHISREDLLEVLKPIPGFRRLALSVPSEKNTKRLGWAIFQRGTNISDVKKKLDRVKVVDHELRVSMQEAETKLVRTTNHVKTEKDHEYLVSLVKSMDSEKNLYNGEENPILSQAGLTDDKLVWYLRLVHSYDYYGGLENPFEDDMPIRVTSIHVRRARPVSDQAVVSNAEWLQRIRSRFDFKQFTADELAFMGAQDPDAQAEAFITTCIEKVKDTVFKVALSGKLFTTEEFARKHIINKHAEKVENARLNAVFLNNFLADPWRRVFHAGQRIEFGGASQQQPLLAAPLAPRSNAPVEKDEFGRDIKLRHMTGDATTVSAPPLPRVHTAPLMLAMQPLARAAVRPMPMERGLVSYHDLDTPRGPDAPF